MIERQTRKLKRYAVIYKKKKIFIPLPKNPRRGICDGCGRTKSSGEIKVTQLHHWIYAYSLKKVKENPSLALNFTNEFCYNPCHRAGDAFRMLTEEIKPRNYGTIIKVGKLMPKKMQQNFTLLCGMWLKEVRKSGATI